MWRVPYQEYRPNMAVTPRFTTNNLGFRSRDVVVPKPEGVYRIACVGGSTTEEGFTNTTTYPAFLEVKLRKHFATDKIEVVNCGITGVDSLIERQRIFDYIAMQPDMIIEYNGVNDICHTIFPLLKDQSTLDRELLSLFRFYNARLNAHQLPPEQQLRKYIQDITIANLQAITRICKAKGVDIAFASFGCPDLSNLLPAERDYYDWNMRTYWQGSKITFKSYCGVLALYNDELKRMCETESAMFIPLAARLKGGTEYFGDFCHMRQLGIEAKAEAVFQLIKDHVAKRTGLAGK
jgi:lysophospholipase L1-like esterase